MMFHRSTSELSTAVVFSDVGRRIVHHAKYSLASVNFEAGYEQFPTFTCPLEFHVHLYFYFSCSCR